MWPCSETISYHVIGKDHGQMLIESAQHSLYIHSQSFESISLPKDKSDVLRLPHRYAVKTDPL